MSVIDNSFDSEQLENENNVTFEESDYYNDKNEGIYLNNNKEEQNQKINHVIHNISKELQIFFENFIQRFKNEMNSNKLNINNPYLSLLV